MFEDLFFSQQEDERGEKIEELRENKTRKVYEVLIFIQQTNVSIT